jgi:hypothetical protein
VGPRLGDGSPEGYLYRTAMNVLRRQRRRAIQALKPPEEIGPGARRDLLRVLTSSSEVRADVIRQFHERGKDDMAEVLIALEENDAARQAVIEELRANS